MSNSHAMDRYGAHWSGHATGIWAFYPPPMGLTLHYELRLPGSATADDVDRVLTDLREAACGLPFAGVTALVDATSPWLEFWASLHTLDNVSTARGFMVDPGKGCESATFALVRDERWHWSAFCKTQYAAVVSDDHFVRCHTSLVALLDRAVALGIEVEVHDEGDYWTSRDEPTLLREVSRMNRIIAGFAGRLSDEIGDGHGVVSPIFAHPRFERLEMGDA